MIFCYIFHRVLLTLESVIALCVQLLEVNQTAIIIEKGFVLVAENVSECCLYLPDGLTIIFPQAPVSVLRRTGRTVSFENTGRLCSPVN